MILCQGMIRWALPEMRMPDTSMPRAISPSSSSISTSGSMTHARAQHAQRARVEDAGGNQPQLVGLLADHQRVPGVVAALVAGDHVGPLGQQVDDLALALVAPLRADDDGQRHQLRPRLSNLV